MRVLPSVHATSQEVRQYFHSTPVRAGRAAAACTMHVTRADSACAGDERNGRDLRMYGAPAIPGSLQAHVSTMPCGCGLCAPPSISCLLDQYQTLSVM